MPITIIVVSIFVIAGFAWALNKALLFRICPICAGVSGTWIWILAGVFMGRLPMESYVMPLAMLMGGSVVGIAYQTEKHLPRGRSPIFWKMVFIPSGFLAVYGIIAMWWKLFVPALIISIGLALWFLYALPDPTGKGQVDELEEKMKKCC